MASETIDKNDIIVKLYKDNMMLMSKFEKLQAENQVLKDTTQMEKLISDNTKLMDENTKLKEEKHYNKEYITEVEDKNDILEDENNKLHKKIYDLNRDLKDCVSSEEYCKGVNKQIARCDKLEEEKEKLIKYNYDRDKEIAKLKKWAECVIWNIRSNTEIDMLVEDGLVKQMGKDGGGECVPDFSNPRRKKPFKPTNQ